MGKRRPNASWFDIVIYHIIKCIFYLLGKIHRETALRLAEYVGHLFFAFNGRHRKVAIDNLSMIYGDRMSSSEIRRFARQVFCSLSMIGYEIGWLMSADKKQLQKHIRFYGLHHLLDARKKGKGVLILTAHIGNWELLLLAISMVYPHQVGAVYRPFDFKPLDMFFEDIRSRSGGMFHPRRRSLLKVVRTLRNNEAVGILLDQSIGPSSGVVVDFFGRPARTSKGLAFLAKSTGAPVIPAFMVREGGNYSVRICPEISFIETVDKDRDIMENTRLYNRAIESIISRYPEQWFWVHRRWRIRQGRKNSVKR